MKIINDLNEARQYIRTGKILAYPTEAVYGLGCDPFNQHAVEKLLTLKQRPASKGLILLIANWHQLAPLITPVPEALLAAVKQTWPGPVTWLFPKAAIIPDWLCGEHDTLAIRLSAHPIAQELCAESPVVSTSANVQGHPPALTIAQLAQQFPSGIDGIVAGELGNSKQPSAIYDVLTKARLR